MQFAAASSVGNETSPGVAGILTGLYPSRNGVVVNVHVLSPVVPTLATVLSGQGFTCGGFVANPVLDRQFGFGNGFGHYRLVRQRHPYRKAKAGAVNRAALEWLDSVNAADRLFLWIHYMEPHGPYEPVAEVRDLFDLDAFGPPVQVALLGENKQSGWQGVPWYQQHGRFEHSLDGRDYLLRYAAEVRSLDQHIDELLGELEGRGLLADSVVVIAADHGEALIDDHGYYFSHDNGLTEDQIATPLLLGYPGCEGAVIERPVSNVDILPTVSALLGVSPPDELDGVDLRNARPRVVVSESGRQRTVRQGRLKLRQVLRDGRFTLVDLAADPGEVHDLAPERGDSVRLLRERLVEITGREPLAAPRSRPALAEQSSALEALGYLQTAGEGVEER
jgi:arylsulfatase